jgi:hypothetical protein
MFSGGAPGTLPARRRQVLIGGMRDCRTAGFLRQNRLELSNFPRPPARYRCSALADIGHWVGLGLKQLKLALFFNPL